MGKKTKNALSLQKKALRKIPKDRLPPPPPPVESEVRIFSFVVSQDFQFYFITQNIVPNSLLRNNNLSLVQQNSWINPHWQGLDSRF
jgi:hypothetical protein